STVVERQHPDGDVEAVGEGRDLAGPPVGAEVGEHLDSITGPRAGLCGEGILDRVGDPEAPVVVEGEVQGLMDGWLARHQLGREAGRQTEGLSLLFRRARAGRSDVCGVGILAVLRVAETGQSEEGDADDSDECTTHYSTPRLPWDARSCQYTSLATGALGGKPE